MRGKVFLSTTGNGLARSACSPTGDWTVETLLHGVDVRCLAADPFDRDRVYAGVIGGVLVSEDAGQNWRLVGLRGHAVMSMAASPCHPGLVYAGTRPARLWVSTDAGATSDELTAFQSIRGRRFWFSPAEKPYTAYVQSIALSPTDTNRIVAGVEFGATVVSTDGGQSWSNHLAGSLRDCHNLYFHPVDGNWVYEAGGTGGGAAYSCDGGLTWRKAGRTFDRHYGWAVTADPADPATWYVSVAPGPAQAHGGGNAKARLYRCAGQTATPTCQPLTLGQRDPSSLLAHIPYALMPDCETPGSLYAGLSTGSIWHTLDRGDHWQQLPVQLPPIRHTVLLLL